MFERNLELGTVWNWSSSPRTRHWYQPICSTTALSSDVIWILSPGTKGRVSTRSAPPTQFDTRSFVAKPSAMPLMPAKETMEPSVRPMLKRSTSKQTAQQTNQTATPEPRLTTNALARPRTLPSTRRSRNRSLSDVRSVPPASV